MSRRFYCEQIRTVVLSSPHMAEEIIATDEEMKDLAVYEVAFHIDPNLSDTKVRTVYDDVHKLIESKATALIAESDPTRMTLAYTISHTQEGQKKEYNTSFFAWIAYEGHPENQKEIVDSVQEKEEIIRHLCIKTTKEEALFAQEREHERKMLKQNAQKEKEEVPADDLDNAVESVTV